MDGLPQATDDDLTYAVNNIDKLWQCIASVSDRHARRARLLLVCRNYRIYDVHLFLSMVHEGVGHRRLQSVISERQRLVRLMWSQYNAIIVIKDAEERQGKLRAFAQTHQLTVRHVEAAFAD